MPSTTIIPYLPRIPLSVFCIIFLQKNVAILLFPTNLGFNLVWPGKFYDLFNLFVESPESVSIYLLDRIVVVVLENPKLPEAVRRYRLRICP